MKIAAITFLCMAAAGLAPLGEAQRLPEVAQSEIVVEALPKARIFLDGTLRGEAGSGGQFTIRAPSAGEHTLRVEMSGKRAFTEKVTVIVGGAIHVRAALIDTTGDLEVFTNPGAQVKLDGKPVGVADGEGRVLVRGLKAIEHKIHVERVGFNSREQDMDVPSDMMSSVTIELQPIRVVTESASQSVPEFALSRRLVGHGTNLNDQPSGAFFLGNKQLVSYGEDGRVLVWDVASGRQLRVITSEGLGVFCVSPDLHWLAVRILADGVDTTRLVDAGTGRVVRELTGYATTFSPDSKRLVVLGEPDVERAATLWDIESGNKVRYWKDVTVGHVAYSPDGRWIVTASEGVTVRDQKTGSTARQLSTKAKRIQQLAFSADGRWLAVVHGRTIDSWELATGLQGRTITGPEPEPGAPADFGDAVFTPDSTHIITVNYRAIQLWDIVTGREVGRWPVKDCRRLAVSPDGLWLAVVGEYLTLWQRTRKP